MKPVKTSVGTPEHERIVGHTIFGQAIVQKTKLQAIRDGKGTPEQKRKKRVKVKNDFIAAYNSRPAQLARAEAATAHIRITREIRQKQRDARAAAAKEDAQRFADPSPIIRPEFIADEVMRDLSQPIEVHGVDPAAV